MRSHDRNTQPKPPRRQRRSIKIARGAAEITAGIAVAIACTAVADTATTSPALRLLIAVTAICGVVLAEWGVRHAVHKARGGNQPNRTPRRSRRG